jgi:amidophosphoribosyltransferase
VEFAVAHNGNVINVRRRKIRVGSGVISLSDTDAIAEGIAAELRFSGTDFETAVAATVTRLEGAFSLVVSDHTRIIGVRDPNGFRPLCLGRLHGGWVLASETAALDAIGAEFEREVDAGEMVIIDSGGHPRSVWPYPESRVSPKMCVLEFVYLSRSDSYMYGASVNSSRLRMGAALAQKDTVDADVVIGVPESGLSVAEGYSRASGIPLSNGLVKNRYAGRSFIIPNQGDRDKAVRRKINVIRDQVFGKRVVVTDDSIVRGTVTRNLARMLRDAGATEVHFRISLPPVKWPCFYGVDIGSTEELLAVGKTLDQMREAIEADSLEFLTVAELQQAIGTRGGDTCTACLTGEYPTAQPTIWADEPQEDVCST